MKWNSFNTLSPSIEKTRSRLFPFDIIEWLKFAIITILSGWKTSGGFSFPNWNKASSPGEIPKISKSIRENYGLIGTIVSAIMIVGIIFTYIKSVFAFIHIEALINNKSKFTWKKNKERGLSLFLFLLGITVLSFIVLGALGSPYIYYFMKGMSLKLVSSAYLMVSIALAILYLLIIAIWLLFFNDFVIPYMYTKGSSALSSLNIIWRYIFRNKVEALVYILAKIVLGIALGILTGFVFLVSLIVVGMAGAVAFGLGYLLNSFIGLLPLFIGFGVILGIILFIVWLIVGSMLSLPFTVFLGYFKIINFEKLTKVKMLRE